MNSVPVIIVAPGASMADGDVAHLSVELVEQRHRQQVAAHLGGQAFQYLGGEVFLSSLVEEAGTEDCGVRG